MKISTPIKITVTSTFLTLLVALVYAKLASPDLINSGALIGIATFKGIDVSQRVQQFYQLLFLSGITFFLTSYFLNKWKQLIKHYWVLPLSILGIMTLVMAFTSFQNMPIIGLILLLLVSIAFSFKTEAHRLTYTLTAISITLFLSGFLPTVSDNRHFFALFIIGSATFITSWILQKKSGLDSVIPAFYPLLGLPIINVLATESYLICNQRELFVFTPIGWKLFFIGLMGIWVFLRWKSSPKPTQNNSHFLYIFVGSIAVYTLYQPFYIYSGEIFELANPANAMMRHFAFNEWPFIDYLSSHFLFEQIPQWVYVILNGYHGDLSFMIYAFSTKVVGVLVGYWFLSKVLSNEWALLIVFLFPFTSVLIPPTFVLALFTLWFLYAYFQQRTPRILIYLLLWLLGITFWRLDFGAAIIPTITLIFILDWIIRKPLKEMRNVILYVGGFSILLIGIALIVNGISGNKLIQNIPLALEYLGASQAHGYPALTSQYNTIYYLHYYIFPVIVIMVLLQLVMNQWRSKLEFSFSTLALLFLGLFYIFNAQRGLVRHGFIEGSDLFISSFFSLFVVTYAIPFFQKSKGVVFIVFSFLIILAFHYPHVNNETSLASKTLTINNIAKGIKNTNKPINRVILSPEFNASRFDSISQFINANLDENQTFIDFTHTPMLYFFAQKKIPSYFNQYLQNTITPGLQKVNVSKLKDIGLVIFNHEPLTPFDAMDGVPNELRYFYLTDYIYTHFTPYKIVNGFSIWKPKAASSPSSISNEEISLKKTKLFQWPWYLGSTNQFSIKQKVEIDQNQLLFSFQSPEISDAFEIEFYDIPTAAKHPVWIHYYDENNALLGEVEFTLFSKNKTFSFVVPIGFQYNWVHLKKSKVTFTFPDYLRLKSINLVAYAP